ncbi:MAG: LytTR family DNA-binding domain-containing protein [Myxococcota bacterium]
MTDVALVRVARERMRVVNVDDVYMLEAHEGDTLVHRRGTPPLRDARQIGEMLEAWPTPPFIQVHRSYAVHPIHVLEVRLRRNGRDWELKLEPPLNTIVPISRGYADDLWAALGG